MTTPFERTLCIGRSKSFYWFHPAEPSFESSFPLSSFFEILNNRGLDAQLICLSPGEKTVDFFGNIILLDKDGYIEIQ